MKKACFWAATSVLSMAITLNVHAADSGYYNPPYPRLMGMNIGAKNYNDTAYQRSLSRLNIAILGFYPGWMPNYSYKGYTGIRAVVKELKDRNPQLLVGQYTVLNDAQTASNPKYAAEADKARELDKQNWWLRKADGSRVQWTNSFDTYDVNITPFTRPDSKGRQWPEWLAERDYKKYFRPVPEFDIWYLDNVFENSRISQADWDNKGKDIDSNDPRMIAAYRAGQVAEWRQARQLDPGILLMGNTDHDVSMPEYKDRLNGAFLEALIGKSWSIEKLKGWEAMMQRYHSAIRNTMRPKLVGFNVWGDSNDYKLFRYGYTSCLMDNGYFSFTDKAKGYSSVPWFDEYNVKLGKPLQGPQVSPWQHGVYRRDFANGIALVNPTWHEVTVKLGSCFTRIDGKQDHETNNGKPANAITIHAKDGIVLRRAGQC